MKHRPIREQVVCVVGSASGIGRETALQFASHGARLVVADNDEQGLRTLTDEIRRGGGAVMPVIADVADEAQVQSIVNAAMEQYGALHTWAHIAGVGLYAFFWKIEPREFRRVIEVNLLGQAYGAYHALPAIIRSGGGALVHVSSVEARRSLPYHSAYASSKHGINGFLEALRVELKHEKIPVSVTEIMPSSINTPFFDKAKTKMGVKPIGVPPLYEPRTMANAILYASEHDVRDIVVGGAGKLVVGMQRLSPRILDAAFNAVGFQAQRTSEERGQMAPNDLWGPAGQYNRVRGDFSGMSFQHSMATWLDLHPVVKAGALLSAAIGAGALLGQRSGGQSQGQDDPVLTRAAVPVDRREPAGQRGDGTRRRVPSCSYAVVDCWPGAVITRGALRPVKCSIVTTLSLTFVM